MLPDTVCHLVTDNSRVERDGVTNNFYQRGAETAMPTLPVRLILACLHTKIFFRLHFIYIKPATSAPASPGGCEIVVNPACQNAQNNKDYISVSGCSVQISVPIPDPATPNKITVNGGASQPIPQNVQVASDYTYTVTPYQATEL